METTRDKVIRMILEEMDSKIEASEIQDDTNLFEDLEIDSIAALDIVSKVEEEWGIRLTDYPELLDEMETVSSFVTFLENLCGGE
jgi:acyl carrier protein